MSSPIAQLVMLAWLPIVIYLFIKFPAQRAVVIGFVIAWLFLPQRAGFAVTGIPDYSRRSAASYAILLATFIYDFERFRSFKFSWLDLPMVVWCLCPFASSITNDLGLYDALAQTLAQTMVWGLPYFLGRIYLNNLAGLRQLAIAIFVGGLIYIPLCLYEIRMSPQVHIMVYGYFPHSFGQTQRLGGWRPQVFMSHGLELGMWMMAATLIGIWLWQASTIKKIWDIPIPWLVAPLLVTFVLVKSTGCYFLLALGLIVLVIARQFRTAIPIFLMIAFMIIYLAQNALTDSYITDQIVAFLRNIGLPEDRVGSLVYRYNMEELLVDKARQSIVFGWGGWGRNRVYEYNWYGELENISAVDSLWIITFGINGLVGLSSVFLSFFAPVIGFIKRYPANLWFNRQVAPAAALVVVLILFMTDCLVNAMINPVFILACGGIAGVAIQERETNRLTGDHSSSARHYSTIQNRRQRSWTPRR